MLPKVCSAQLAGVRRGLECIDMKHFDKIRKFYLTGCGDSYDACVASVPAFKKYADSFAVRYETLRPMEAARYFAFEELDKGASVMCAISASGGPKRIREILERADENGFYSLTITNRPDSPAAQAADFPIIVDAPGIVDHGPGFINYFASLAGLMSLAAHYGEYRGFAPEGSLNALHERIAALAEEYDSNMDDIGGFASALADELSDREVFEFVGDGAEFATAYFSAEKMIEANGAFTAACDSATFMNSRIYEKDAGNIPVFFFADKFAPGAFEIGFAAEAAHKAGRPTVFVCVGEASDFGIESPGIKLLSLPAAPESHHFITPLFDCLVGALFASDYAAKRGLEYFGGYYRGGPFKDFNTIPISEIKVV